MFTRILVPTDFSTPSDAALAYARDLSHRTGASLHLLHVADNLFLRAVLADPRNYESAAFEQLIDRASTRDGGPAAVLSVERSEEPAEAIVSYAQAHSADLIVMGTHGRGRVANVLLGSVAQRVARSAPCPVLTLRAARPDASYRPLRILVPTDFGECAASAFDYAKRLAAALGGSVRLLHVVEHSAAGTSFAGEIFTPEPAEARARVLDARLRLSNSILADTKPCTTAVTSDVVYGPTGAMIAAYAGDANFDLIVMGTHGRRGLAHFFMGSIAESVIRTAACPVLTMGPHVQPKGLTVPTDTEASRRRSAARPTKPSSEKDAVVAAGAVQGYAQAV